MGLPFIVTDAIANTKEIVDMKCGIVIQYNADELANAVVKFLKNKKMLKKYRENALRFAKNFDNEKIFSANLKRVLEIKK